MAETRCSAAWSGTPQLQNRVVLGLASGPVRRGVPVLVPGVHALEGRLAGLQAGVGAGEEYVEVLLRAGLRGADGSDHLRVPAMHAGCALRRRGGQHNPPGDRWPDQRDLLGDEAADGEPEQVHLAQLQGGDECDRFPRHLFHGARCRPRRAADARVIEGDDPPACCQRVNQRGIPAVEVAAEVLEQDQRQGAAGLATGVAVGVVDAIGCADGLVRQAGVGAVLGSRGHVSTFLAGPPASGCSRRRRHSERGHTCSWIQVCASVVQSSVWPAPRARPRLCGPWANTCTACGTPPAASAVARR